MRVGRRLILAAGIFLIAVGIGALYWSHQLATGRNATANSWWEGTLQALGVGFAVGGLIDVLAVSGIEGVSRVEEAKRKDFNTRAREILNNPVSGSSDGYVTYDVQAAMDLLAEAKGMLDENLQDQLYGVISRQQPGPVGYDPTPT